MTVFAAVKEDEQVLFPRRRKCSVLVQHIYACPSEFQLWQQQSQQQLTESEQQEAVMGRH